MEKRQNQTNMRFVDYKKADRIKEKKNMERERIKK